MKCTLCGSQMKNGVCTFCGMNGQQEKPEEKFNKNSIIKDILELVKDETSDEESSMEKIEKPEKPARRPYTKHYERRHIHDESSKGSSVSSLMVKTILLIILMMFAFVVMNIKKGEKEISSDTSLLTEVESAAFISDIKCEDLIAGETYVMRAVVVDAETMEPLLADGIEITGEISFIAESEEMKVEMPFDTDITALELEKFVILTKVYHNDELISEQETLYMLNGKIHVTL